MDEYSELAKLAKARPETETIGKFLEWFREKYRCVKRDRVYSPKDCKYMELSEICEVMNTMDDHINVEELLAEYKGIDMKRVEEERRDLIKYLDEGDHYPCE